METTTWIEVVDENGDLLLGMQTYWLPIDMTAQQVVEKILPCLTDLYKYRCYYIDKPVDTEQQVN